jgi:aspartate racemase
VTEARIGLIGGLSWASTSSYYQYLYEMFDDDANEWSKPPIVIDSIDFGRIVALQRIGDWSATGSILVDSAQRLERAGATVLGIGANTMHINYDQVQDAVNVPVIDVRTAVATEVLAMNEHSVALLGTKYLLDGTFYSDQLEALGVASIRPSTTQIDRLQTIIFDELTNGIANDSARIFLHDVALSCIERGARVIALCCTEFGLLMNESEEFPVVDSTKAHVRALLAAIC